jgi:hypothetical protein
MPGSRDLIILNTTNYTGGNTYKLRFPSATEFKDAKLSLYSFSMYNSTYNISQQLNNNKMYFKWFDGTNYTFTVPDGYYSVNDLNTFLHYQFIINNLYAVNSSGSSYIYFIQFQTNAVQYKCEIDTYYVPSATNAQSLGYKPPSGATWSFPANNTLVQLTICPGLQSYFGLSNQATFPASLSDTVKNYQFLSNTTPIVSPVFSYILTTNIVQSNFNQVASVFAQFPINVQFGQLINITSVQDSRIDIRDGIYSGMIVQLWTQDFNPLVFQDPELTLFLIVER